MATRTENCENLASNKRRRGEIAIDRITSLPEHVLRHILSLLPTKDAVKTSALSKPWQFLWISVPALDFSFPETTDHQFVQSIDKTLIVHSSPKITKFAIDFPFEDALKPHVDNWVRFAVRRHVEVLKLRFRIAKPTYFLPSFLYNYRTLTELSIINCLLHLPAAGVHFPSLKQLTVYAPLTDRSVGELLSGCPSLESLILGRATGVENVSLSSTSLKRLSFINRHCNSAMEVCAPNLRSLTLALDCCFREHRLIDVSSLVNVKLSFSYLSLIRVRESIPLHGEQLTRFKGLLQQLKKVEQLTLETSDNYGFKQETCDNTILDEAKAFWRSQQELFACLQCSLKRVKIIGFVPNIVGWEFVVPLVEFFLNNALVLEEMFITDYNVNNAQNHVRSEEAPNLCEAKQQILGYKRASPAARVLFSFAC